MLFVLIAAVFAKDLMIEKQFYEFKMQYGKNYSTWEEHERRLGIFKENLVKIEAHNAKKLPWTMGVTQFSDMTPYEFTSYVKRGNGGGYVPIRDSERKKPVKSLNASCTSVDWVAEGKITPVKNQGQCGSCWSFSTTGSIEGRSAIKSGTLASISEQQLVDCDTSKDHGCNGGLMDYGFEYVISSGGLCSEVAYPYEAKQGTCQANSCGTKYDAISSYEDVASCDQDSLESALCEGPVSIAIEADQSSFQQYTSGVLTSDDCGKNLDHGVLLVGFGTDATYGDYWKVKNSWGAEWGEEGYIRLCRNCQKNKRWIHDDYAGQCGLMMQPSYPVV